MNTSTLTKLRILVIDDSEELLEVFKYIFEKKGFEIIIKSSPNNIVQFVQDTKIDVLILNVMMGGVNGRLLCKELKLNPVSNYFPIILMSANSKHLSDFKDYDADGAIEKPFTIGAVVTILNSFL